jgi:hypothetical protein
MRVEAIVLLVIALFGAVCGFFLWAFGLAHVYVTMTSAGTIMLGGVALLGLLPGGYYFWWSRRMTPRAEDDSNAETAQGAGVVGAFPGSSIWPFVLGIAAALIALSLVFGIWTAIVGFPLAISAAIGVITESRHGGTV